MKKLTATAATLTLLATGVHAGGIERTTQSVAPVFEPGNYLEFNLTSVSPDLSGTGAVLTPGVSSGDMAPGYGTLGTALKMPINENIDVAFIFDQPFGADVAYPAGTGYFAQGSTATLDTTAFTGVGRYKFGERFSVFGGLRFQTLQAEVSIPFVAGYTAAGERSEGFGYVLGAAYEIPDIKMRVALSYNSKIKHDLATTEASFLAPGGLASTTTVETPQSINLEAQTGIAPGTLLRGSVRWVNWSDFSVDTAHYRALTTSILNPTGSALVSYNDDTITYNLGLVRVLNENWALAGGVTHEPQTGGFASNLSPHDGKTSVAVGAVYTQDAMRISAGLSYIWIGDAATQAPVPGLTAANFTDNSALGFGMTFGFHF